MSSLALQLFVNLNKLVQPQSCAGLGSNYAKHLVDRVRQLHPHLLSCSDPSNAHTAALSAFALGIGLRELRHESAHPGVIDGVASILKIALERADDSLEHLAPEEVHLVLQAHEEYKTHQGVKNEPGHQRGRLGATRGAADVLPNATINGAVDRRMSWKDDESTQVPPLHASDIDVGDIELGEISQAMTGEASFQTEATFAPPSSHATSEEAWPATDHDTPQRETDQHQADQHDTPHVVFHAQELDPENAVAQPAQARASEPVPAPTLVSHAGQPDLPATSLADKLSTVALATLHPVRQDRVAEREFSNPEELAPESVDSMLARRRQQQQIQKRQEIPLHAAWEGPVNARQGNKAPVRGSALEPSEWSETAADEMTYLHSESAPDSSIITRGKKARKIPTVVWASPTFLAVPPLALFYGGVLWGRREYGQSLFALSLGVAGAAAIAALYLLR